MKFDGKIFRDEEIRLDYNQFVRCQFYNCNIHYGGGGVPVLIDNLFKDCSFIFDEAAGRTRALLSAMARSGADGRDFVLREILGIPRDEPPTLPAGSGASDVR